MAQNLQLYRNSIDSNLFDSKSIAIEKLKEKLSVAHDGEIVLARYKDGESIETIFGIAVSGTNENGYTIFENAKEITLGSDNSSRNFLENEGTNGEQVLAVREITSDVTKTAKEIKVAGITGTLGAGGYKNGDVIPSGTSIESILMSILCKESFPTSVKSSQGNISSSVGSPTISLSNTASLQEVGASITLNSVTCGALSVSTTASTVTGLTYGYSLENDNKADSTSTTIRKEVTSAITNSQYDLRASFTGFNGKSALSASGTTKDNCKISSATTTISIGTNRIDVTETGPVVSGHADAITSGYVVSNVGNTTLANTTTTKKYDAVAALNKELTRPISSASTTITGVYPCYNNISGGKLVSDTTNKLTLQSGVTFTFTDVPSENANNQVFMFDFPATHTISSFKIKGPSGFADFTGSYSSNTSVSKTIQGNTVNYKRLKTSSPSQGVVTYEIKLNKALNQN